MRELSEMLQKLYPAPPDRLPARPWWRFVRAENAQEEHQWIAGYFERSDARIVPGVRMPHTGLWRGLGRRPDFAAWSETALLERMEQIDRDTPLPHPGFRAGQVWVNEFGGAVTLLNSHPLMTPGVVDETDRPLALSEFHARIYAVLLIDPCCPHLAPWSPA